MAVTADQLIKAREPGRLREFIVKSGTAIYAGTLVFVETATGHIHHSITSSKFVGVAKAGMTAADADGVKTVDVYTSGAFTITCSGTLAAVDVGKRMEAVDNYDCKVADALNATEQPVCGYLTKFITTTKGEIEISPTSMLQSIDATA